MLLQATSFWDTVTTGDYIAFAGLLVALASLVASYIALRPQWEAKQKRKRIEASEGAELYDATVIERDTRFYVEPDSMSVDPGGITQEMKKVVATRENLATAVDRYLKVGGEHRYLLLLADSGMGKTAFVLNYYARNQALPAAKRRRIAIIPLGIPDADERISAIKDQHQTTLFLDAFDEDTRAIKDHKQRIADLMHLCRDFARVLITCRTQFFPSDEEITRDTGIVKVTPRRAGEKRTYEFWKLYLAPLTDEQVEEYLCKRYPFFQRKIRRQAQELVEKVPLLSVRPMLLTHIPDLIAQEREIKTSTDMYEAMVDAWLDRESYWVEPDELRVFSERLAVDMHQKATERKEERIKAEDLGALVKAWGINLKQWQVTGRSLLNRDAEGNLKFSHRSIMEYLVATQFVSDPDAFPGLQLTDQMRHFCIELLGCEPGRSLPYNVRFLTKEREIRLLAHCYLEEPQMVEVPEGPFIMGSNEGNDNEKPAHEVLLSAYEISVDPVTNAEYEVFVLATGREIPRHWEKGQPPLDKLDHPVVYVSWDDAHA